VNKWQIATGRAVAVKSLELRYGSAYHFTTLPGVELLLDCGFRAKRCGARATM
jgi:hypothetical protein